MTNLITLTIPNDDHVALRAFGKALEEMALAHGAEPQAETLVRQRDGDLEVEYLTRNAVAAKVGVTMEQLDTVMQVDTTVQQVESLATNVVQREVGFNNPPPETSDATTDSTGTPWDERIHSASKALNSDGTWRLRRKPKDMDEAEWSDYVTMIKADLQYPVECGGEEPTREEVDELIEASNEMLVTIESPVTPPGDDFHTDAGVVTEQTVAGIPPIPVPPVATGAMLDALAEIPVAPPIPHSIPVPAADEQAWDFPKLMKFLTEKHGRITVEQVNALLAVDGLAALTDLNAHPDKIGPFVARVKAHLGE